VTNGYHADGSETPGYGGASSIGHLFLHGTNAVLACIGSAGRGAAAMPNVRKHKLAHARPQSRGMCARQAGACRPPGIRQALILTGCNRPVHVTSIIAALPAPSEYTICEFRFRLAARLL